MVLTHKQQKKLKHKLEKKSLNQVAQDLHVSETDLSDYCRQEHIHTGSLLPHTKTSEPVSFSWREWFASSKKSLLFLVGLVVAAYFYTLNYAFLSDDIDGIVNQNLSNFSLITNYPFQFGRNLIYFLINTFFGKAPWIFRLTNISSQIVVVLAVFLIISLLVNARAALFSALLVAVHPLMIESVTWVSGGGYSSYTALCLVSLLFFIIRKQKKIYYWISFILFLGALEFSEKAAVLPGILLIYLLIYEDLKKAWKTLLPFFVLSGLWIIQFAGLMSVRQTVLSTTFSDTPQIAPNPLMRAIVAISSYVGLIVWPDKLTLYHSEMTFSVINFGLKTLVVLFFCGSIIWCWCQSFYRHPWLKHIAFWLLVFLTSLTPTLASGGLAWIVAERYAYFGAIGVLIVIGILIERWGNQKKRPDLAIILIGCLGLALFTRTVIRNLDWQNQDTLWLSAERTSPNSAQNNNNLGDLYSRHGDLSKAITYFTRATQLQPCYGDAYHNLAHTYLSLNQTNSAIKYFNEAIRCKPILWQSHEQLAAIYFNQNDFQNALAEIDAAIKISPHDTALLQDETLIHGKITHP